MDYVYAAVLGLVQGVAEFLPISSDGHLVLAEALLRQFAGGPLPEWLKGLTMIVALHFGSLLAILIVYIKDVLSLVRKPRLLCLIVLATIPVGLVGLFLKDQIDAIFDQPIVAGFGLLVTAAFLLTARRFQRGHMELDAMPAWVAVVIGMFQAVAILPGVSRSGSTIASGVVSGLNRPDAARFSFLIAMPAIGGATLLELKDLLTGENTMAVPWMPVLFGTIISFVVGLFCLRFLIRLLSQDRLHWFAYYCIVVGLVTIAWQSGS